MGLSILSLIRLSCSSLLGNPVRSFLSGIGVFMGVAAVSATLQVENISRAVIKQQLDERDAPQIEMYATWSPITKDRAKVSLEDLKLLQKQLKGLKSISASNWMGTLSVSFQNEQANPYSFATTIDFLNTLGRKLIAGRSFNYSDFETYQPVVIIDQFLADKLFGSIDPLGKTIYINFRPYVVVGVVVTKPLWNGQEPTGIVYLPMAIYSAVTGQKEIDSLLLRPSKIENLDPMGEQAKKILEKRFSGYKFDFGKTSGDILERQKTLDSVSKALLVVGAISLIVGGVGIANITIASVIERTPEIGLRRAVGATQLDIMLQFILEAAILSFIGGTIAIITVHGATILVAKQFKLPYQFNNKTAALALSSAILVGVGAGFFPALRASQLDPVKALRGE
ncbi:ABC transporter permease [Planktothrix agardhii 1029]|jgi:putative ABC transport system permease protein|uniref:ABC transporter permease n=1 Tax=Planktothrix agardhii TaxID=1160 RepID=UPI001D0B9E10|nr:ABC transporter permease [Planktothrix agardhii]MCB8766413.1 ABC transporter permease [Planktothrix agardhii 1809]MCB8779947.1 ABC transporter permease [Planktothrix agardhii 1031]MCB8784373.1 ABC transporter permease [Planktothrix agardhii 1808]MCF3564605.1 ABC transporter permease [Planktothrix agardhii 1807]MCF3578668.1 ABC transporter permease [Planktothrix agardhii 1812]